MARPAQDRGNWWQNLQQPQSAVLVALIALIPSVAAGVAYFVPPKVVDKTDAVSNSISQKLSTAPGFRQFAFPSLGIGFLAPADWSIEEAAALFGGGELELVKRYVATKGIIGVKFRIRSVQKNYVNDMNAEVNNQLDVYRKIDPSASVGDTVIYGKPAKVFKYVQATGQRMGEIRVYWVRLIPEVKLELIAFIYTDEPDKAEFWTEVDRIIGTLVLLEEDFASRRARIVQGAGTSH